MAITSINLSNSKGVVTVDPSSSTVVICAKGSLVSSASPEDLIVDKESPTVVVTSGGGSSQGIQGEKGDKGEPGPKGDVGPAGPKGDSIKGDQGDAAPTKYVWIKYADTVTPAEDEIFSDPNGRTYIGIAYNRDTEDGIGAKGESDYTQYRWSKILGKDGSNGLSITGPKGDTGDAGQGFNWLGVYFVDPTEAELGRELEIGDSYYNGTDGASYTYWGEEWYIFSAPGLDGITYYTWIKYADSTTPIPAEIYDDSTGHPYIGIAYNRSTPLGQGSVGETDYTNYIWTLLSGTAGADGEDGTPAGGLIWKGSLSSTPSSPSTNWLFQDSSTGIYYLYDGYSWQVATSDGRPTTDGIYAGTGERFYTTYSDSVTVPSTPTGDGDTSGWSPNTNAFTLGSITWVSQQRDSGWSTPIDITGLVFRGPVGFRGNITTSKAVVSWDGVWSDSMAEQLLNGAPQQYDTVTLYDSVDPGITETRTYSPNGTNDGWEWI